MAASKNCEITKAFEDLSSSGSSEDSDFDDIFSTSHSIGQISTETSEKQQKLVQRMPTRRPDPNVFNRNALLARENRRKKKAYVETLEKELDGMKYTNKKLHKLLRKQMKMVKKLEHEKQYYKGLIANQTDILNLVSVLNAKNVIQHSPKASSYSSTDSNRSTSSLEPLAINYDGSALLLDDPFLSDGFINDFNFFTDSIYEPYNESNWDQLLGMDDGPLAEEDSGHFISTTSRCEVPSNISGEHNYFSSHDDFKEKDESGLCLHITRGKISVEYCPTCHLSAKRCSTLPDQLLVVD